MRKFDFRTLGQRAASIAGKGISGSVGFFRRNTESLRYYAILFIALSIVGGAAVRFRSDESADMAEKAAVIAEQEQVVVEPMFSAIFPEKKKASPIAPVRGEILAEYTDDRLAWNEDLQQWQIHPATDYAADAGEAVAAVFDGVVLEAYCDYMYGNTIVIDHGEYGTIRYASLGTLEFAEVGAHVLQGETIGSAGICPAENAMGPHLHLECLMDGMPMDFEDLLRSVTPAENERLQD